MAKRFLGSRQVDRTKKTKDGKILVKFRRKKATDEPEGWVKMELQEYKDQVRHVA